MEQLPSGRTENREPIDFRGTFYGKYRVFAAFLLCGALVIAAFAVSAIYLNTPAGDALRERFNATFAGKPVEKNESTQPQDAEPEVLAGLPEGAKEIRTVDLSTQGSIVNETPYLPVASEFVPVGVTGSDALVLILHTHSTEAYLPETYDFLPGEVSDVTFSEDPARNVLAVGETLAAVLNEKGIPTIHCTVAHTGNGLKYSGAYARSAESIRQALEEYPGIRYVIDLHRDAVLTGDGAYVRSAGNADGERVAQVMAVVGTDCAGTEHPGWRENLSLALALTEKLEKKGTALSRPVTLKNSSYNQELSRYGLLLEIGTGADTVEEANRAARLVGEALAELIQAR